MNGYEFLYEVLLLNHAIYKVICIFFLIYVYKEIKDENEDCDSS